MIDSWCDVDTKLLFSLYIVNLFVHCFCDLRLNTSSLLEKFKQYTLQIEKFWFCNQRVPIIEGEENEGIMPAPVKFTHEPII